MRMDTNSATKITSASYKAHRVVEVLGKGATERRGEQPVEARRGVNCHLPKGVADVL